MKEWENLLDKEERKGKGNDIDSRKNMKRLEKRVIEYGRKGYKRIMNIDGVDKGGVGEEKKIWRRKEIEKKDSGREGLDKVEGEKE